MSEAIEKYLDRVMVCANLPQPRATEARNEQRDHLEEKIERLTAEGVAREDAIFRAIDQHGNPKVVGYGLRGWRWIDVRSHGTARGFIAIGPKAVGVIAMGGMACGVFACGGLAAGVVSFGGLAAALLFAGGGVGLSLGMAYAGLAIATLALGGMAIGLTATGGMVIGLVAYGGKAISQYTYESAPVWLQLLFDWTPTEVRSHMTLYAIVMVIFAVVMISMGVLQFREHRRLLDGGVQIVT